jgi:hypothetical protein
MNGGRTVKPRTGAVTMTPISPPRPSVVASRNFERGKRTISPSPGSGPVPSVRTPTGRCGAGGGTASAEGSPARNGFVASRIQRTPKIAVTTTPIARTILLMIRPMKMQAMPTAKPTGQMVGVGSWEVP